MDFIVSKRNGQWVPNRQLQSYRDAAEDGRYILKLDRHNKRSNAENRFFHGVLVPEFRKALNEVGYNEVRTDQQAKDIIKSMFLKTSIVNEKTGEYIETIRNTSDLSKIEMANLFDEVIRFAAENLNYQIPYPNEQLEAF